MNTRMRFFCTVIVSSFFIQSCGQAPTTQKSAKASLQSPLQEEISKTAPFEASWESLKQYEQAPEWFGDAKFGIYAHWGPYSAINAPSVSDWYGRYMYIEGTESHSFHLETYGPIEEFGYKDFIPMFTAENFDADAWADLYVLAGAKFAGPVAEHADGFAMWDSELTEWDSVEKGPKRDVVAEMEKAIRARGLKFLTSFHHHWKWGWYPTNDPTVDASNPAYAGLYGPSAGPDAWGAPDANGRRNPLKHIDMPPASFSKEWLAKVDEVVEKYQPDMLWFDNRMTLIPEQTRIDMAANFYNSGAQWGKDVVLTYKTPDMPEGTATIDLERSRMSEIYPVPWLTDTSLSRNSWGYAEPMEYYSARRMLHDLIDIVSKNGNMLLNIGPKADGTIPQEQIDILTTMGKWLDTNGEAIYSTRPWLVFGEGPTITPTGHLSDLGFDGFTNDDIRYTRSKDGKSLYAIQFGWQEGDTVLSSLAKSSHGANLKIRAVESISNDEAVTWSMKEDGLHLTKQSEFKTNLPVVFKISLY